MSTDTRWVAEGTVLLRESQHPLHVRLRELLTEKRVNPATSLLAHLVPEGRTYASGVVLTETGRVYEFEVRFPAGYGQATLASWTDVSDSYQSRTFSSDVDAALALARTLPVG